MIAVVSTVDHIQLDQVGDIQAVLRAIHAALRQSLALSIKTVLVTERAKSFTELVNNRTNDVVPREKPPVWTSAHEHLSRYSVILRHSRNVQLLLATHIHPQKFPTTLFRMTYC